MALLMKCNSAISKTLKGFASFYVNNSVIGVRNFAKEVEVISDSTFVDVEEEEQKAKERENLIERKRNVSRLNPEHRNLVHEKVPFLEPQTKYHLSVKYRRKMYGKYGSDSGVNPGIMWPTKKDIKDRQEYESVAYRFTIQEMVQTEVSKQEAQQEEIWSRQKKIAENVKNLNKWMDDLEARRAKKIKVVAETKAKKDRLVEEVRRHFGYTVDHREEKFQLMLEQKEKEEKKLAKMEKKKRRDDILMQELVAAAETTNSK